MQVSKWLTSCQCVLSKNKKIKEKRIPEEGKWRRREGKESGGEGEEREGKGNGGKRHCSVIPDANKHLEERNKEREPEVGPCCKPLASDVLPPATLYVQKIP